MMMLGGCLRFLGLKRNVSKNIQILPRLKEPPIGQFFFSFPCCLDLTRSQDPLEFRFEADPTLGQGKDSFKVGDNINLT